MGQLIVFPQQRAEERPVLTLVESPLECGFMVRWRRRAAEVTGVAVIAAAAFGIGQALMPEPVEEEWPHPDSLLSLVRNDIDPVGALPQMDVSIMPRWP